MKSSRISMLAIVLSSIALLLVISFVVIKVAQNCKTKYRIVNQNINQNVQLRKDVSLNDIAVDLVKKWDAIHNSKKTDGFAAIYAPQVKYYHQSYTPEMIVKSKRDFFAKTPGFLQVISKIEVTNNADGSLKIHFDKLVQTSAKEASKTYPSYLVIKKINGKWLIIEESDDVTDANLAKKKAESINIQTSDKKNNTNCFVSGLNNCKSYNINGGDYVYNDGRRLEVSIFMNQTYMDCVVIDESGNRDYIGLVFDEIEKE